VVSKSREASKSAKEAAEISARASQEAIRRAEEVNKSAREIAEAAIRAAKEATEASKKGGEEVAEAWAKVFNELITSSEGIGKMIGQVPKQIAELPARRWQEAESKASEIGPEEVAKPLTSAFAQMTSGAEETNLKGKKGKDKKIEISIESRLESLSQMFAAGKDKQAEENNEEEET